MDQAPHVFNTQYCMLLISHKMLSSNVDIDIDFGKNEILLGKYNKDVMERTAQVKEVSTLIDALNYMTSIGWEFVQAIVSDTVGGTSLGDNKYLMKRITNHAS